MGFSKTHSGQNYFLKGHVIDVEVDISRGLHSFSIVGLPDKAVEEARDRISAAIKNSGFTSPKQKNQRVVISLAPAHIKKEGTHFDLAMAIGYLVACGEIDFNVKQKIFIGELSLNGNVRKINGVLPIVISAVHAGFKEIFIPYENLAEVKIISGIKIFGITNLKNLIAHLDQKNKFSDGQFSEKLDKPNFENFSKKVVSSNLLIDTNQTFNHNESQSQDIYPTNSTDSIKNDGSTGAHFEQIIGQPFAKRALEISAAGGHNILMTGPPGTGKTLLANALRTILPKLNTDQSLEVTSIHSIAGLTNTLIFEPPFRTPHHTSSYSALIGGGTNPRPGEITLAHHGVLFLDEFPEFDRRVIETLRQPLEEHRINIVRTKGSVYFPANFILVAAMNPCPCGFNTSKIKKCVCGSANILKYKRKISGPILDRIDLFVEVGDIEYGDFQKKIEHVKKDSDVKNKKGIEKETTKIIKKVLRAREKQTERFNSLDLKNSAPKLNNQMSGEELTHLSNTTPKAIQTLLSGAENFKLSMRAYHRVWRVARTIADLDDSTEISDIHVLEAFQFRRREV